MRIAVLANLKQNAPQWEGMPADQWDDLDSPKTVEQLIKALEARSHEAVFFEGRIEPPQNLIEKLLEYKPDLCFNIAESHFGDSRESQIPSVLEMLRIPYTGSKVLTLALALDKPMTKRILHYHGLPTPEFQVFERADEPVDADLMDDDGNLRFPLFVKPSREGTSMGVTGESIVYTVAQLRDQIARQQAHYNQPILVEHYIRGREVTVGVIGNLKPTTARRLSDRDAINGSLPEGLYFFPPLEANVGAFPDSENGVYTNRMKVELADVYTYSCPALLDTPLEFELKKLTAAVFQVTGCKDVARVDFRLDADNGDKPYILEINPLPGMTPGFSDLCLEADAAGWTHEQFVNTIVDLAAERHGLTHESRAPA